MAIEEDVLETIVAQLVKIGLLASADHGSYDAKVKEALKNFVLRENFDDHWSEDAFIDETEFDYLKKQ